MICLDADNFIGNQQTAIVLGKFDGIHLGHQKLIEELMKQKQTGLATVAFTFLPLPDVFFGYQKKGLIISYEDRRKVFQEIGIDYLVEFPMNEQTAAMDAEDFLKEYFIKRLNVKTVIAGEDVSFGYHGNGNKELLQKYGKEYNFDVKIIQKLCYHNREISSSYVRKAIEDGDIALVNSLLGRPLSIEGEVIKGYAFGRTLNMPTANIRPREECILPPFGVYLSYVYVEGQRYYGLSNFGKKPTVAEEEPVGLETYLFQWTDSLYGKRIKVELLTMLRKECKFSDVSGLKQQLQKDKKAAEEYFDIKTSK